MLDRLYSTEAGLAARQSIYRWARPPLDLPAQVATTLADVTGVLVDVGCGNGGYLHRPGVERPDLRLLGIDLSVGMLAGVRAARPGQPVTVADVAGLPLADASVDAALAMHMLYHLPQPGRGAAELRRVLRPGGRAVIATNARDDKVEIAKLLEQAVADAGAGTLNREFASHLDFSLEALLPVLGNHFDDVAVTDWRTEIVVPEPAPVLAYLDSLRPSVGPELAAWTTWARVMQAASSQVADAVRRDGAFVIRGHVGMAVCR